MNVLAIGDLHAPFTLKEYLPFCRKVYRDEKCNEVVFIGDVIDNHYSSYHETDPDGYSAKDELHFAKREIRRWYKAFPSSYVCVGNHDRLVFRKAHTAGVSKHWIRDYSEVLETPMWDFTDSVDIDDVTYVHGDGKKALQRAKADMCNMVQGHYHTEAYIHAVVGKNFRVFGAQVGCGIDHKSYAMAYAKYGPKPAISCIVVKNGVPDLRMMKL